MSLDISKVLNLSTGHLSDHTCNEWLKNNLGCWHELDYGWLIYAPDFDSILDDKRPEDLVAVRRFAREHGCDWVKLDSDGPYVDQLPEYHW